LRDRLRPPGAGLHRRVVRHHDDRATMHHADAGHDARRGRLLVVAVVRDQETELDESCADVAQPLDALPGRELALRMLSLDALRAAATTQACLERAELP